MVSEFFLLPLLLLIALICVRSEPKLPDAPIEWLELKVQTAKFSDTNVVYIGPSEIHGRGVMSTRRIKRAGKIKFLQYFEVAYYAPTAMAGAEQDEEMAYIKGFIPEGGDIGILGEISVKEAIRQCNANEECEGITYRSHKDDVEEIPASGINFKAKGNVMEHDDWRSYIKKKRASTLVSYPLGCATTHLNSAELEAAPSKELVACGARLVNHSCKPTCEMVPEDMGADFAVPGLPWTKGRVKAIYLHALGPIDENEELTVDYNTLPGLMSETEQNALGCDANDGSEEKETGKSEL